jgi:hypothetical protein
MLRRWWVIGLLVAFVGCGGGESPGPADSTGESQVALDKYTSFRLTADLSSLSDDQRKMIPKFLEAAQIMDGLFWQQAYGDRDALLASIDEADVRQYVEWNYGPWDRLEGNAPFVDGVGAKPAGANLYPADVTKEEVEAAASVSTAARESLESLYTIVRRDEAGGLIGVPYTEAFGDSLARASQLLEEAAELAEDPGFAKYLKLRAEAFLSNDYLASDLAWMDMKDNSLDLVIGPIETYEDALFGRKAAFEAYILIKDMAWSERLAKYSALLPGLQENLPVPARYKTETPGTDSDLNAYDVIFYAGDCNAGSKTIAINLPNDERVQLEKGTRRVQIKNAMQAKFDKILVPIVDVLIDPGQRDAVTFDAFFSNTMFHEVAHGLGVKNTINGSGTVRSAMQERASALEEGKADVLGLYMVSSLIESGEWTDSTIEQNYTTFVSSIFRSIRFGTSSAHGRANLARFNFFREQEAIRFDAESGFYSIDPQKMPVAVNALSEKILTLQGDGDYEGVGAFMETYGVKTPELETALNRLSEADIPVDIVFEQGADVLQF